MSFLKAEWRKLALANYVIDPELLKPFLPFGTELDFWNNQSYVSLVGFMFQNTRLLGLKIPYHIDFEEVNLRFYVKRNSAEGTKRGVVFIKEIVPKPALTFVANTIYKENYETMPMNHSWVAFQDSQEIEYRWRKKEKWNRFKVWAGTEEESQDAGSESEFITEHYWGYARISEKETMEYEVTHPKWKVFSVNNYEIDVDFGAVYGQTWAFLKDQKPFSVMLAEGSEITVEKNNKLTG